VIRVVLPAHLRTLARIQGEVELEVVGQVTQASVLDALESRYPMLQGTIRDHGTRRRRAFLRFFACERDLSNEPRMLRSRRRSRRERSRSCGGAMAGGWAGYHRTHRILPTARAPGIGIIGGVPLGLDAAAGKHEGGVGGHGGGQQGERVIRSFCWAWIAAA
jgi:hypothetical protein